MPATFRKLLIAETAVACIGCAVVGCALAATPEWFDQHFLPSFFVSRANYLEVYWRVRVGTAIFGIAIALIFRRAIARFLTNSPGTALSVALSIVMAFGAAELALRQKHFRASEEVRATVEPRRQLDDRLGWLFVPSRAGYQTKEGAVVEYAFDRNGYRVRTVKESVDFNRPTIVFTGESMMVGERLSWRDTIAAQTARMMGMQGANLAVSGFASDQAYLRLKSELPRFRRPAAVVTLFTPSIFDRNLDVDRPHLGIGLVWLPPENHWRLAALFRRLVHYRSSEAIERGIVLTRQILYATRELAKQRGAVALIVVPQFGAELPREGELRRRILDDGGLDYVFVPLDSTWRVPDDGHPNSRAAREIAAAIAAQALSRLARSQCAESLNARSASDEIDTASRNE